MNLGMMGMHGEAWVNTAIQEADLLIAVGMRFDDRVTGDLRTYARNARKIHIEVDRAEINKNVKVDAAIIGDAGETLANLLPHIHEPRPRAWLAHIKELKGDSAVRDIQILPDSGHLYAAHVINDLWKVTKRQSHRRHRRGPAPDVGSAVLPPQPSAHADHFRRTGHHGICAARGHRRQIRQTRRGSLGGGGRRRFPDDHVRTGHHRPGKDQHQDRHHQQRLSGMVRQWQEFFYDKRYVATPLVAPDFAALANAFGIRGERITSRKEVVPTIESARQSDQAVLLDFRVEQEDSVYPMVPAGASLHEMIRRPNNPLVETATEP